MTKKPNSTSVPPPVDFESAVAYLRAVTQTWAESNSRHKERWARAFLECDASAVASRTAEADHATAALLLDRNTAYTEMWIARQYVMRFNGGIHTEVDLSLANMCL